VSSTSGPEADAAADGRSAVLRERGREFLARRLGIDARGLAAFRIALGLLVLADLLFRARDLRTFYTDAGVLPRAVHAETAPLLARLSVHSLTGSTAGQAFLFLVAGCLAVALLVGFRTRAATVGVTGLHASMYARNPALMNGGDGLLILALALGAFVPLGARWSVDAVRRRPEDGPRETWVVSLATATLLAQLVIVYLANAAFKHRSDVWMDGTAVQSVLELEQFAVRLGPVLTDYPALLVAINWLWVAMLFAAPLLLLATGWRRTLVVAGFVLAHLGMLATMRLGLFPLVVVAMLLVYLPPEVWDRVERQLDADDSRADRVERLVRDRLPPAGEPRLPSSVRRAGRTGATVLVAVVLVASVLWPVTALGVIDATQHDPVPDPDGYTWTLFAPNPPSETRWFVAPATLESGDRIDAFDGSAVDWGPPRDAAATYPSTLWHRYLGELRWTDGPERTALADYLCRRAGGSADARVTEVALYAVEQPVGAGDGAPERTELVRRSCDPGR
jgi:hypothetical protein